LPDLSDLVSFVAILPDETACYAFLQALHKIGSNTHFRDYLSKSKPNGYRSLHSNIRLDARGILKFYIRTPESHEQSQFGFLNELRSSKGTELQIEMPTSEGKIFVITDRGEVHILPEKASPVDLAYKRGDIVGHRFNGAIIYGQQEFVKADYCLEDGDIVHILSGENYGPQQEWLKYVKTDNARKLIKSWKDQSDYWRNLKT
jgi:(p)ppGpp synthase/HD superfamily hydrolase